VLAAASVSGPSISGFSSVDDRRRECTACSGRPARGPEGGGVRRRGKVAQRKRGACRGRDWRSPMIASRRNSSRRTVRIRCVSRKMGQMLADCEPARADEGPAITPLRPQPRKMLDRRSTRGDRPVGRSARIARESRREQSGLVCSESRGLRPPAEQEGRNHERRPNRTIVRGERLRRGESR